MQRFFLLRFVLPVLILFSAACNDILFEQPQPSWIHENTNTFPEFVRGYYYNGYDTIEVKEKRITQYNSDKKEDDLVLSDSLIFRVDGKNYFLNFRVEGKWVVFLVKDVADSISTFELKSDDDQTRKKLAAITEVRKTKSASDDSPEYIINPSAEEFRKILDTHIFQKTDTYRKIPPGKIK